MAPRPFQERSWGVLGRLGRGLGPLWGAFGPSLDGLGRVLDRLEGVFGGGFIVVLEFIDSIHRLDFLMRFVDSIRWFDSLIRLLDSNRIGSCHELFSVSVFLVVPSSSKNGRANKNR